MQRLDRDDTFYSLVPYRTSAGVVAIVSVDARSGEYRQAIFLTKTRRDFIALGPDDALERVAGRRIEFGDGRVRLLMRREAMSLYPHLVWRPCRESLSPYLPFYMFTAGSHQLYVRVDGAIFSSLTLGEMGL